MTEDGTGSSFKCTLRHQWTVYLKWLSFRLCKLYFNCCKKIRIKMTHNRNLLKSKKWAVNENKGTKFMRSAENKDKTTDVKNIPVII